MPAIATCPHCGFTGPHGFDGFPYTTRFYHDGHEWYSGPKKKVYLTFEEAVRAVHQYDSSFNDLWVAYMLDSRKTWDKRRWSKEAKEYVKALGR